MMDTLLIALVGLPARGKSTMGRKIARTFELDALDVRVFNNGELRRTLSDENTSSPDFFSPANEAGLAFRDQCALKNLQYAREFFNNSGKVAIIDASNVTRKRRKLIEEMFSDMPATMAVTNGNVFHTNIPTFHHCKRHHGHIAGLVYR